MDELDLTSAESKVTYAEIKDYVLNEHGLKVFSICMVAGGFDLEYNYHWQK